MKNSKVIALLLFSLAIVAVQFACKKDDGDPDGGVLPTLSIAGMSVTETDQDFTIDLSVTLTGENKTNAVVLFAALPKEALAGSDFEVLTTGDLVFTPGVTEKKIQVKIKGDNIKEPVESFEIKLYNATNATVADGTAVVTITDDDELITGGLVIPSTGYSTPATYAGKTLLWADEFDAASLDLNSWTYEIGDGCPNNCGWGNNEAEYYRSQNTSIVDGNLVITAKKENFSGKEYTSSRLITKGKREYKFGRIDIRAALPGGQGLWPALWMLGSNLNTAGWPACGEIDIMELTGDVPNRVLGTVHYGANVSSHQYISGTKYLSGGKNFQDEFHVFSLIWEQDKMQFLIDDEIYHTITPASLNGANYPFNQNFFFIFNVAVGGNWPGYPDGSTVFPQYMIVDYIRVFQ